MISVSCQVRITLFPSTGHVRPNKKYRRIEWIVLQYGRSPFPLRSMGWMHVDMVGLGQA